jgi:dihydrofolate reductase
MISIIAAVGKNNELGKGNTLLWHLPADLKHFREITSAHAVVMGRKTFESLGKPLPNRRNIIITRDANYKKEGVEIVNSLSAALDLFPDQNEEVFIIGGGELYKQTLPIADKLYITHVDASAPDADTFFPEIIPIMFLETSKEEHQKDDKNPFNYTFATYTKF